MFVNGKFHLITKVKIVKKCIVIGLYIVNLYWLPPANEVWGKGICSQVSFLLSGRGVCIQGEGSASREACIQGVCIQVSWGRLPLPSDIQDTVNDWRYASYWNAFLFKMCVHCKPMVQSVHYLGKWLHLSVKMGLVNLMLTNRHFHNTLRAQTP